MWKCPKCGREFAKVNQGHYCGEKPKSIDEYIMAQDEEKRADLQSLKAILVRALPDAQQRISWSMPTFWNKQNIVHFAASKKHIGFYTGEAALKQFGSELAGYETNKGTIRIPYGKIDSELIEKIAKYCWAAMNISADEQSKTKSE